MMVNRVMDTTPAYCVPFDTVEAAASIMKRNDIEFMPVVENEPTHMLVGVVTDRDLCLRVLGEGKHPQHTQIGDVMTAPGIRCRADDDVRAAEHIMRSRGVHHLPVLNEQGALVGVIALADVLRAERSEDAATKPGPARKPGRGSASRDNGRSRGRRNTNANASLENPQTNHESM